VTTPSNTQSAYRAGTGSSLVLLHGLTSTWHVWRPVIHELARHHDVYAPTLPWHDGGRLLAPNAEPTFDLLVGQVEAQLDEVGITSAHLVGNSLGGWVALELARRNRARSVVVFSPAAAWRQQADYRRVRRLLSLGHRLQSVAAPHRHVVAHNRVLRKLLFGAAVHDTSALSDNEVADQIMSAATCKWVHRFMANVGTGEPFAPLDISMPITVAWAQRDRILPFERYGRPLLDRLVAVRSITLPGVGHVPMSDNPRLVVQTILAVTHPGAFATHAPSIKDSRGVLGASPGSQGEGSA
jgi:pimeloyl-ACP methyl ester carboxylesterase